jgi:hypothetical protein
MRQLQIMHGIRSIRLRRRSNRRERLTIRNSTPLTYDIVRVTAPGDRDEARARRVDAGADYLPDTLLRIVNSSTDRPVNPRGALRQAGYRVSGSHFTPVRGDNHSTRPAYIHGRIVSHVPHGTLRRPNLSTLTALKNPMNLNMAETRSLAKAEEVLRGTAANLTPSASWHAGHLIGHQFGGPMHQNNLVPMTAAANSQADTSYADAESWIYRELSGLRGGGYDVHVDLIATPEGYGGTYTVPGADILARTSQDPGRSARVRWTDPSSPPPSVTFASFIPSGVDLLVRFTAETDGASVNDPDIDNMQDADVPDDLGPDDAFLVYRPVPTSNTDSDEDDGRETVRTERFGLHQFKPR